jgi:thymidylate synthase
MFRVFEAQTADEVWKQIATAFQTGQGTTQSSRLGEMHEILHSAMSISDPRQRWISSRLPPVNIAFAIAEVVWILTGRNESKFLNYFNRQLPKYAGQGETYHGAYGYRIRKAFGFDQLERAYLSLKAKPSSRQIVLQIWDGRLDLPNIIGREASPDIPCNVVSILRLREDRLEWMQIMRSNDMYRGLPYNIVQFTTLQEVMAGWLEVGLGEYNQISNSLHVYQSDLEQIQTWNSEPLTLNTDSLAFAKQPSEKYFRDLALDIESIIAPKTSTETLVSIVRDSKLPTSFRNMLCVVCAEGVRRRGQPRIAEDIIAECSNQLYRNLYSRWLSRFSLRQSQTELATTR